MALGTYSELQTAVASFLHRSDLTSEIQDFIRLAEADLQVRARLEQWTATSTVSLTSGSGSLPNDFYKAVSVTYGAELYALDFLPKARFDAVAAAAESGSPVAYTISGTNLLVYPLLTGSVTLSYTARFTALSNSATTNSLLTNFPDVYLEGALFQACVWDKDSEGMQVHGALFNAGIDRVKKYVRDYAFPDVLQMRAA